MTAASCQLGSMNDTTLPGGIRDIRLCANVLARPCRPWQSSRISPSITTVRFGVLRAASRRASASVERTQSPRRYASAARAVSMVETLTGPNLALDPAHGHRMAIPRRRVGIDGDLCDLAVRRGVGALHFECGTACFDLEERREFGRHHHGRDLLV